jgi:hypothetical protein
VKTEQLVSLLATRVEAVDRTLIARRCGWALGAGIVMALALTLGALHLNPTLSRYLHLPMFWAREVYCIALAVAGFFAVARLARPGVRLGWVRLGIMVPVLAMWGLAGIALLATPPEAHLRMILGESAAKCPFLIALIGAPVFIAYLWILRSFAPTHLRLAGAAAGFAAGSLGALVYSLHCPELAAPFVGIWYLLGMLIPMTIGASLGPRLLRW